VAPVAAGPPSPAGAGPSALRDPYAHLAVAFDVGVTTAYRYIGETVELFAAAAPQRAALLAAGATLVREQEDLIVMADPEGNEFCLLSERH